MEKIVLNCQAREASEDLRTVRASKLVPAVVYGKGIETTLLKIDNSDLLRAYRAGKKEVIEIVINGKSLNVTFQEVQKDPVTGDFWHVDFLNA